MSINDGHRQRLKDRFRQEGLDNFPEIYVLELLLFYCIPRQDTKPLARKLLDHFGSLSKVMEATPEELAKVSGVGEHIATFLPLVTAAGRYYQDSKYTNVKILRTIDECGKFLLPKFHGRRNETVFLLCLDAKGKVLACKMIGEGSVNSAGVPIRRVVEAALAHNSSAVVLAHNHPSGLAIPSTEDVETTRILARALQAVEIVLTDHLIVADNDYVSMIQSGLYNPNDID